MRPSYLSIDETTYTTGTPVTTYWSGGTVVSTTTTTSTTTSTSSTSTSTSSTSTSTTTTSTSSTSTSSTTTTNTASTTTSTTTTTNTASTSTSSTTTTNTASTTTSSTTTTNTQSTTTSTTTTTNTASTTTSSTTTTSTTVPLTSDWNWYKIITITGQSGAGTDYQVKLEVGESAGSAGDDFHLSGKSADFPSAKGNGGDLLFTDSTGVTPLDFWVEAVSGSGPNRTATIWVKVEADLDTDKDIRIYYDNSEASNLSDGDATFPFFDDFTAGSLDTGKWDTSGAPAVDGSDNAILDNDDSILGKTGFGVGYEIRARAKCDEQDVVFVALSDNHWLSASNILAILNSDDSFPDDFDRFALNYKRDGASSTTSQDGWTDFRNTYYQYWIKWFSASSVLSGQESDSAPYGNPVRIPTVDLKANFQVFDSSQQSQLEVDWVFIKKVIATEPAFGSAGTTTTTTTTTSTTSTTTV